MVCVEGVRACVRALVAVCVVAGGSGGCRTHTNAAPNEEQRVMGGSGTRAKGEEGSMGNPAPSAFGGTPAGPSRAMGGVGAPAAEAATVDEKSAASFGMVGLIGAGGATAARQV